MQNVWVRCVRSIENLVRLVVIFGIYSSMQSFAMGEMGAQVQSPVTTILMTKDTDSNSVQSFETRERNKHFA